MVDLAQDFCYYLRDMSGHSKWHNIQKKKGAADAKRGSLFTKLAKAITIAAKSGGGGDPEFNFQLRVATDAAKAANMPKDNIDRAVKRGTGEGDDGGQIEEVVYEGFGPGGVALLIQCLTDNRNRSNAEVRTVMNKNGGNPGEQGSVMWMFQHKGVVTIADPSTILDRDQFELAVIDAGAEDLEESEGVVQILSAVSDLKKVMDAVEAFGIKPDGVDLEYRAKDEIPLIADDHNKLEKLVELLEELDDVDTVFTNEA